MWNRSHSPAFRFSFLLLVFFLFINASSATNGSTGTKQETKSSNIWTQTQESIGEDKKEDLCDGDTGANFHVLTYRYGESRLFICYYEEDKKSKPKITKDGIELTDEHSISLQNDPKSEIKRLAGGGGYMDGVYTVVFDGPTVTLIYNWLFKSQRPLTSITIRCDAKGCHDSKPTCALTKSDTDDLKAPEKIENLLNGKSPIHLLEDDPYNPKNSKNDPYNPRTYTREQIVAHSLIDDNNPPYLFDQLFILTGLGNPDAIKVMDKIHNIDMSGAAAYSEELGSYDLLLEDMQKAGCGKN